MDRNQVITTLAAHRHDIEKRGAKHIALFGSLARNEATTSSDIDLMVELDPALPLGVFEYVALVQYIEDLFPVGVDVANKNCLKPYVQPQAERDAIYAF